MGIFYTVPAPAPVPSPELNKPWRPMTWNQDNEDLRREITNFQSGNPEVNTLRILLHGPQGAGKSSFFNSVNTALQGRITTRALADSVNAGRSFTLQCKTYKVKKDKVGSYFPFTFTDIAGINTDDKIEMLPDDIAKLLKGQVKDGYVFNPLRSITENDPKYNKNPDLKDKIHCLVAVLPANTVSMMEGKIIEQMRAVREKARDLGVPQVLILTKVDEACELVKKDLKKIYTSKKIKQKMEECSKKLGIPVTCTFPVKNYHMERKTEDTVDILIFDALRNIVNFANDYVEDQRDSE